MKEIPPEHSALLNLNTALSYIELAKLLLIDHPDPFALMYLHFAKGQITSAIAKLSKS